MDMAAGHAPPRRGDASIALFASLLDRFAEVVGTGAAYATFHFAAVQEGLEWVRRGDHPDRGAGALLDAAHRHLGLAASHTERGDGWRIDAAGDMVHAGNALLDGIALGFYEGVLRGATGASYEGRVERGAPGDGVNLEIKRKGA